MQPSPVIIVTKTVVGPSSRMCSCAKSAENPFRVVFDLFAVASGLPCEVLGYVEELNYRFLLSSRSFISLRLWSPMRRSIASANIPVQEITSILGCGVANGIVSVI